MRIFISWSGEQSRDLAEALRGWIPKVIQGISPFVSSKDIDKGASWVTTLNSELADCSFGILCLTSENLLSPWLNYEAGAISSAVGSRVCPLLFGIEKSEVKAPLSQLQLTSLEPNDLKLLMRSLNKAAGEAIAPDSVDEAVDTWWPKLQAAIGEIPQPTAVEPANEVREPVRPEWTMEDATREILDQVRMISHRISRLEGPEVRTLSSRNSRVGRMGEPVVSALLNADIRPSRVSGGDSLTITLTDEIEELPVDVLAAMVEAAARGRQQVSVKGPKGYPIFWAHPDGSTGTDAF